MASKFVLSDDEVFNPAEPVAHGNWHSTVAHDRHAKQAPDQTGGMPGDKGNGGDIKVEAFDFLGEAQVPFGTSFGGLQIGGLSAITYDAAQHQYYALADDRSANARFFTLELALDDGSFDQGDVIFTAVQTLSDETGNPFVANSLDPEGLTLAGDGTFYLSSEGDATTLTAPFVAAFSLQGQRIGELPVPNRFLPTADQSAGIRNNLAFEALTLTPDGKHLYVGSENALYQDGAAASASTGSPSRILEYSTVTGQETAEFIYQTEPVQADAIPAGTFSTNGLVELLALDNHGSMLALERAFSTGVGNDIKLYLVNTDGATDVSKLGALAGQDYQPVEKTLLLDLGDLGITLDNLEGMTFGPDLADGRKSLVLVADDNFAATQVTQFLAFAVDVETAGSDPWH